jgi:hypothetical protein
LKGGDRNPAIVSRNYRPGPDHCARALELLLRKTRNIKEAAPESRPDAGKEINERSGNSIIRDGP